jgi:hypothetical protein
MFQTDGGIVDPVENLEKSTEIREDRAKIDKRTRDN